MLIGKQFSLNILQYAHKDLFGEYALSGEQRDWLTDAYDDAIEELAGHARDIVEGYGFTEWEMDSALAKAKETPYEALFKGAQDSEMNHVQHLWPFIISIRDVWKEVQGEKAKL